MENRFFERPILNSPYSYPLRHWELDDQGQPTQQIIEKRRRADFVTPIPKPKKRKGTSGSQTELILDEGKGLSTASQQYETTSKINEIRRHVDNGHGEAAPLHLVVEIKGCRGKMPRKRSSSWTIPGSRG